MFRVPFCRTQACRACTHRTSTRAPRRGLHRRATPARRGRSAAVGRRCAAAAPRSAPRPDRPVPAEAPATASPVAPADEDAMQRVTRLARQSLEEAKLILGERRITPEQRRAWQDAARRYWQTARGSVRTERPHDRARRVPSNSLGAPVNLGVKEHGRCVRPCQPAMRHDAGLAQPWASRRVERGRGDAGGRGAERRP